MNSELILDIAQNSLFAALFIGLLGYALRENGRREDQYRATIDKLTDRLGIVADIRYDVKEIKKLMKSKGVVYAK